MACACGCDIFVNGCGFNGIHKDENKNKEIIKIKV
jgi:hypothetical protein